MIKAYFRIAWRNLWRNKVFSLVNLLGLTISMASAMLILLWVADETSFDSFFPKSDQVYRITQEMVQDDGGIFKAAATPAPLPQALKENYPEIIEYARLRPIEEKSLLAYKDTKLYESVTYADSTFFKVFDLPMLVGNRQYLLEDPNSIVLSRDMAEKIFGKEWEKEPVLGKEVRLNNTEPFKVTGVMENLPASSHLKLAVLLPFSKAKEYGWNLSWGNNFYYAYVLLKPAADPKAMEARMTAYLRKAYAAGKNFFFQLQPVKDIHLYADMDIDLYGSTTPNDPYIRIFLMVAVAVIGIACINFMNLSTARSEKRAREIGLRKTIGVRRSGIIVQLLGEAVLFAWIAFMTAVAVTLMVLPVFNDMVDKSVSLWHAGWKLWAGFSAGAILIGILAGSYPAFYLSAFRPVQVLKGSFGPGGSATNFRRVLVVLQFGVAIILILVTVTVYRQFQYVVQKDLGYDKEQMVYMPKRGDISFQSLKEALMRHSQVKGVSSSSDIPLYTVHAGGNFEWDGKDPEKNTLFYNFAVSMDYIDNMGLRMVEGRNFSPAFPADSANYILNEEALRTTGIKHPVGKRFKMWGREGTIIGIVKDFNFKSLRQKIEPLVLRVDPNADSYYFVKIAAGNTEQSIRLLEKEWNALNPEYPFEYHFLDEEYAKLYESEQRMGKVFNYFTAFTLFISCLGLFGLVAHMAEKRRKEIGIRKVLGSGIKGILKLLSTDFVKLILLAFIIATPIGWWAMNKWLEDFAYRVSIQWWMFALAGLGALLIALLTVSFQVIRAATANPVDSLRDE